MEKESFLEASSSSKKEPSLELESLFNKFTTIKPTDNMIRIIKIMITIFLASNFIKISENQNILKKIEKVKIN